MKETKGGMERAPSVQRKGWCNWNSELDAWEGMKHSYEKENTVKVLDIMTIEEAHKKYRRL